jgi:glutamate carboxypeptidase
MLAQVESWAAVNSGSRNFDGLARMAALLADAFSALPGEIDLVEPSPVETITADGRTVGVEHGRNLRLRVRPHAPVQLLLTGHMDTVFGVDHPFQTLRWIDEGTLNGPGVSDMKGGLALMLAALQAVEASPLAARLGYEVVINSDEEVGSPGSATLIAEAARGKVAHAGRNPEDGRNAIVAAADLALRLARAAGPGLSVNPAKIDGGAPNNVVPDRAILRVNLRPSLPEDERGADALIGEIVSAVAAEHQVRIHRHGGFGRPPKPLSPEAERLFGLVRECGTALGIPIAWRATGGVCDGNNIAACGVPVIDTMGARGGAIHSEDEFLIVESLAERARLSALVLLRLAERGRP